MSAPAPSPLAVVDAEPLPRQEEVLTEAALAFVAELHRRFTPRRDELLARRAERRAEIARTSTLDFLPETAAIRADDSWKVAPAPAALNDRRVEITGPTDRKMTINALNSGAKVWLADFEDASAPTWENVVLGQVNLIDAYTRKIDFTDPRSGKSYALKPAGELATVVMRPRGWHLEERHLTFDGRPVPGALVDFGLYFFHNAQRLIDLGKGPYFYLPKTESHLEARLWNDIFVFAQDYVGIPQGTVRATVLIETITAAYEMEEILYELRDHAAGLNAGRWDYLFSIVKNFRDGGAKFVLPDRNAVTMTAPFMRAYARIDGVMADVGKSVDEIRAVMTAAGYAASDYRIVLQSYPSPIPRAADNRYGESGWARTNTGGCPFWNADSDWARDSLVPQLAARLKGVATAKGVQFLDLRDALQGREVCAKAAKQVTATVPPSGTTSEWARWIDSQSTQGLVQESMHPNAYGQQALGRCLALISARPTGNQSCRKRRGRGRRGCTSRRGDVRRAHGRVIAERAEDPLGLVPVRRGHRADQGRGTARPGGRRRVEGGAAGLQGALLRGQRVEDVQGPGGGPDLDRVRRLAPVAQGFQDVRADDRVAQGAAQGLGGAPAVSRTAKRPRVAAASEVPEWTVPRAASSWDQASAVSPRAWSQSASTRAATDADQPPAAATTSGAAQATASAASGATTPRTPSR
ncbi:hypothetical protein STANM309S_03910 [Streptomyces tanashiensis]